MGRGGKLYPVRMDDRVRSYELCSAA